MSKLEDEYKAMLKEINTVIENCKKQNEVLIQGIEFYANRENWKTRTAHLDCGTMARDILKEVAGL